jgi:flagellar motility protein MotE (MotC chaperone)
MAKRKTRPNPRRLGIRPLVLVVMILLLSGLTRFGIVTTQASAADAVLPDGAPAMANVQAQDEVFSELLADLQARKRQLDARETAIENRMLALRTAEQTITENLTALVAMEDRLEQTLSIASQAATEDLSRLVDVYENMKPGDAAALFQAMPPDFAAGFISRMRSDGAAQIMAGLPPDFAYAISVIIAGRNSDLVLE